MLLLFLWTKKSVNFQREPSRRKIDEIKQQKGLKLSYIGIKVGKIRKMKKRIVYAWNLRLAVFSLASVIGKPPHKRLYSRVERARLCCMKRNRKNGLVRFILLGCTDDTARATAIPCVLSLYLAFCSSFLFIADAAFVFTFKLFLSLFPESKLPKK